MIVSWTARASDDVRRLRSFAASWSPVAATRIARMPAAAPDRLVDNPRIGATIERYSDREVRRLWVGEYEMRYELRGDEILILRVWHGREDR